MTDREQVRATLDAINDAWLNDRLDDLPRYLHPDVVFVPPGHHLRLTGRDACVQSYRDFLAAARLNEIMAHEPAIDVFGDTAVAMYRFDADWVMDNQRYRESGYDLFVFTRTDDGWLASFRTQIPIEDDD